LFPLALDYKSVDKTSGHLAQYLIAIPTLGAGMILCMIAPRFAHKSGFRSFTAGALVLTLFGSLVPQLLEGNEFGNYLRVLLPFLLFTLSFVTICHPWNETRIEQIEKALFWANVVALIFTLVYGFVTVGGGGLVNVRYRIVSPTFLALQAVLLHEFVIAKRYSTLTLAIFGGMVVIELLSVTRSLLLGSVLLFLLATWMGASSTRQLVKALLRAALIGGVVVGIAWGSAALFPSSAKEWTIRIFAAEHTESGRDPTTITRLAEMKDQYDQVTSSAATLLLGEGYGHYYRYSPEYLPELAGQITEEDFYAIHEWAAGHNFWVYQLFAGGLLFGIALPLALVYALVRCVFAYRKWRTIAPTAPDLPVLGRAILMLAALPAISIGGNPLGERFSGVVFGAALGLMVLTFTRLQRLVKSRTRHAREPAQRATRERQEPQFVNARDGRAQAADVPVSDAAGFLLAQRPHAPGAAP
jgi:hypothetical protein